MFLEEGWWAAPLPCSLSVLERFLGASRRLAFFFPAPRLPSVLGLVPYSLADFFGQARRPTFRVLSYGRGLSFFPYCIRSRRTVPKPS